MKKKSIALRLLTVALCLALCLGLCTIGLAAGTITGVTLGLNENSFTVSGTAQTVTVTINLTLDGGDTVAARGANYQLSLPTGWTLEGHTFPAAATIENASATAGMWALTSGSTDISSLGTLVIGIPANTPAGTYTIAVSSVKVSDASNTTLFENGTATATVNVSAAPANTVTFETAASAERVKQGESVDVTLTLKTADVLAAGTLQFAASKGTDSLAIPEDGIMLGSNIPGATNEGNGKISFGNSGATGAANLAAGTLIATVTFATDANTPVGTYTVSVTEAQGGLYSADNTPLTPDFGTPAQFEVYEALAVYTVTFDSDGGTPVPAAAEVTSGEKVPAPTTVPVKSGYDFQGWYLADALYDFETPVTGNITLKAVYTPKTYTVTVKVTPEDATLVIKDGETVIEPNADGSYTLTYDKTYTYTLSAEYYSTVSGEIKPSTETSGDWVLGEGNKVTLTLPALSVAVGDVDGDGSVLIADAQELFNYLVGKTTTIDTTQADVNGDGTVNSADIVPLLNLISKLASTSNP